MTVQDYMAMLRRRIWWIAIPLVLGPIIGLSIAWILPAEYTSRTLILVEGQKVPENYVKSTLNDDILQRLATMQEQILSRTRLQPIIERFGLYKEDQGKLPMEELLERMRKNISVSAVQATFSSNKENLPGFYISFTADNPRVAQQVCAELTSMFITENLKSREQSAQGTTEFLAKQLDEAKRRLDELDKLLAEFKGKHLGALPGQEQTNMNLLMGMNTQLDAVTQALSRLQQDKLLAENVLTQQLQAWEAGDGAANPQTLEQQLSAAQAQLAALETRYTDKHPDVLKAREAVASLRKKIEAAGSEAAVVDGKKRQGVEPESVQKLRIGLHSMTLAIKEKQAQQARLQDQIRLYQARVAASPMVEEQAKQLTRDYEIAHKFYNDLLAKKTLSEMATDMERRQQGENFRVMDPASLPEKPSFPDRTLFGVAGAVAGLALGFGLAMLVELRDKALRSEEDIEFYLELPTLAAMPTVGTNGNKRRFWQRRGKKAAPKRGASHIEQGARA